MIREALGQSCGRYLLIQVEASGNLVCRWRDKTGDQDDNKKKDLGKVALPVHLRLVQTGKDIQVFTSTDGQNWGELRMSHAAVFDEKSRIGLFVCSGNTFSSTTAVFDSVKASR
jgi:regulation of enolase protein 1 (concanavalin A-like superfamily)